MRVTNAPISILFVEDMPADTELSKRELEKGGIIFQSMRVDTRTALLSALESFRPDIVISDYSMPMFDGMSALLTTREYDRFMPFIILTGSMNEETAVICMKAGASDYVIKEHMSRLPYAVLEAIDRRKLTEKNSLQEELLRQNEERYHSIFSDSKAVMLIIDPDTLAVIDANNAALEFYGWTKQELLKKNASDINTLPIQILREQIHRAVTQDKQHFEFKHRLSDGSIRDVESHSGPIRFGGKSFMLSIIHDISERVEAQHERDQIAHRLSHYLQLSPTITYSLRLDGGTARIEWVSENIEPILGYSTEDTSKPEWWFSNVVSADRSEALMGIPKLIEKRSYSHEYRFMRKNRSILWIRDEMRLFEGEQGNIEIIGTLTDISANKVAESEIKLKSAALEALNTAVVITDREGNIEWVNHGFESLTGYSMLEAEGKNLVELLKSGKEDPALYRELWDTILSGQTWRGDLVNRKKSGEIYNEETIIAPVMDSARKIEHFIAVKDDVTEKTRTRERREASLREKEVLLREIHHRVKNNMQVISSLISLSSDKVPDSSTQELLDELHRRINAMSVVHEQFYSAVDVANIDFSLYITQLTNNLIEEYQIQPEEILVEQASIPLLLDLDMAIPAGLIISELVSNSFKVFRKEKIRKGILSISIYRSEDDIVTIKIHDNGPGLPPDIDPKMAQTLGFRLIDILSQQLQGSIAFGSSDGMEAILQFPYAKSN
jgi:PAS domain S-box-containing protein